MCTLIVVRNVHASYPLVVAANRDEMLDRPSAPPKVWDHAPRMLAPVDLRRDGTWIGVNEHGVFAALTNRIDIPSEAGRASRGELVVMALEERTAGQALGRIVRLDARRYNGFHLVVADLRSGYLAYGDGAAGESLVRIGALDDGLNIVTNLGVGQAHGARSEAVMREWRKRNLGYERPHVSLTGLLLSIHDWDERRLGDPGRMRRMEGTCIHRPAEDGYGTKSSAFIRLRPGWKGGPPAWLYSHRERATGGYACEAAWQPELALPIVPE